MVAMPEGGISVTSHKSLVTSPHKTRLQALLGSRGRPRLRAGQEIRFPKNVSATIPSAKWSLAQDSGFRLGVHHFQ